MKKLLGIFLAVVLASQLMVLPASAKVSSKAEHSWRVVTGLGLADFSDNQKETKVTRAEFAQFVAGALGITADTKDSNPALFERAFYGDFEFDGYTGDATAESGLFEDVAAGDAGYEAIYALKKLEIMSGDGTGYFHPERNVKYEEVLKTFVVLASYNVDAKLPGTWANGYVKLASDLDIILKGVSMGTEITKYQLCQIFYNLFDVEMLKMIAIVDDNAVYDVEEGVTFLNEMLGLYSFDGQLTATANGTIYRPYTTKSSTLEINGNTYTDKTQNPIGSMLGREVEAYRTEDGEVVFMTPIDEEEVKVIDADDVLGYNNGSLEYEINGKTKSLDIKGLPVIYNGVAVPNYSQDIFDLYYGNITVTEEAEQNVVIIWNYKDLIAKSVNQNKLSVYDEITGYKLELDNEENTVYIFDENGKRTDFDDISEQTILLYIENGTYKEVYIGGEKLGGKLVSINPDEMQVEIGEKVYEFSDAVVDNNVLDTLSVGMEVTAYKNMRGKIFHIKAGKMTGELSGILLKVVLDDNEDVIARFFDGNEEFVNYNVAEKVTFTNSHNETVRTSAQTLISLTDGYTGYCVYTLNASGVLTKLQMPLESKDYLKPGEEKIYQKPFALTANSSYAAAQYRLGSNIFLNAEVDFYSIPTDTANREKYDKFKLSDVAGWEYFSGTAYFKNDYKPVPAAVVVKDRHLSDPVFALGDGPHVVTKITETVTDEDALCKEVVLTRCSTGENKKVYSYYENGSSKFDNVKTLAGTSSYNLEVGDIVLFAKKTGTDELAWIKLLYSCNMESPAGADGNNGWLADMGMIDTDNDGVNDSYSNKFLITKSVYDEWKASAYSDDLFTYADSLGSSLTLSPLTAQNPFRISSMGELGTNPHFSKLDGNLVMLGSVVDYYDGFLKLTTQDLSCESYNPTGILNVGSTYVGINFERYFNTVTSSSQVGLIEYYDNGVNVAASGYPEDIYTYKNSGKDCSRVLVVGTNYYIILNDYRTK